MLPAPATQPEPARLRVVGVESEPSPMDPPTRKTRGFARLPHAWIVDLRLSAGAYQLAGLLSYYAHGRCECNPSNGRIAEDLGVSLREVKNRLNELEAAGIISRTYRDTAKRNRNMIILSREQECPREGTGVPSSRAQAFPRGSGRGHRRSLARAQAFPREGTGVPSLGPPPDPPIRKRSEKIENKIENNPNHDATSTHAGAGAGAGAREDELIPGPEPESTPGPATLQADPDPKPEPPPAPPAHDRAAALALIIHTAQALHGMAVDRWASEYAHLYAGDPGKTARILAAIRAARESIDAGVRIRSVGGYIHTIYRRLDAESAHASNNGLPQGNGFGPESPRAAAPAMAVAVDRYAGLTPAQRRYRQGIDEWDAPLSEEDERNWGTCGPRES